MAVCLSKLVIKFCDVDTRCLVFCWFLWGSRIIITKLESFAPVGCSYTTEFVAYAYCACTGYVYYFRQLVTGLQPLSIERKLNL